MKNEIDLSKIKAKELPEKKIKANFDGTEKEYIIRAFSDGEKVTAEAILQTSSNVNRIRDYYVFLISTAMEIDQLIAVYLYDNVTEETIRVGQIIHEFVEEFENKKAEESKTAEKNSKAEMTE
jgi:hypothetical protein